MTSIKYLEFQVQKLINLNCVTKFRYLGQYSSFFFEGKCKLPRVTIACKEVVLNMMMFQTWSERGAGAVARSEVVISLET